MSALQLASRPSRCLALMSANGHKQTLTFKPITVWCHFSDIPKAHLMPKYFPINAGVSFESVYSDLLAISWKDNDLSADFVLPKTEGRALRVRFDKPTIVRVLDEFPLSTEDDTKNE